MTPIRVLRVITRLNIGGPAIQAALLTARLDPTRYDTRLVAGKEGPSEGNMLRLGRLPDAVVPTLVPTLGREISPFDDLRALASVVMLARRYRPHIVHTHLAKAGFVGRIAGRLSGARVILHTYHGSVFRGYFGPRRSAMYLNIERALARITTRILAITPQQVRELVDLRIAEEAKFVLVPLGLELGPLLHEIDTSSARRSLGMPDVAACVALVARLVPVKDVPTFLRAVALVARARPDLIALIVGDGADRDELERLARELAIADRCRFLGWRADVRVIYAAADVVALSSSNEGTPVSLIEAMAAARPVVATAVGGVPDVVREGETGLLVPPGDAEAFARAVLELLAEPERRAKMGRAGRALAYPAYDVSRLVHDIDALYVELLELAG